MMCNIGTYAQGFHFQSSKTGNTSSMSDGYSSMRWSSPYLDENITRLSSLADDDTRTYAKNIKENISLMTSPQDANLKFISVSQTLEISNPYYDKSNLLNHIYQWILNGHKEWKNSITLDLDAGCIECTSVVFKNIANYVGFFEDSKVSAKSNVVFQLIDSSHLQIIVATPYFVLETYSTGSSSGTRNRLLMSKTSLITDVYPWKEKSQKAKAYALAYVNTYKTFYNFISKCLADLNDHFSEDKAYVKKLRYENSTDSLKSIYGEPTNILELGNMDINKEIRIYEQAEKVLLMGKTLSFKDIKKCTIEDDPTIIPGKKTTVGGGVGIFFVALGGSETYTNPDKTIHNYTVNIESNSFSCPLMRIVTGRNQSLAKQIEAYMQLIIDRNKTKTTNSKKTSRKKSR